MQTQNVNEFIRRQILNLQDVKKNADRIPVQNKPESELKDFVSVSLSTATDILMTTSDLLIEAESITDESELENLLTKFRPIET